MTVRLIRATLVSCLAMLAVSACASSPSKKTDTHGEASVAPTANSILGSWELKRWTRPNGQERTVLHPGVKAQPITLRLGNTPTEPGLTGFSGCNRFMGQFAIVDGGLQVPMSPASTNMACGPSEVMSLEHEFLQGLSTIQATRMQATTHPQKLVLTLKSGDVWEFDRFIDPIADGAPGVTKLCM